MLCRAISAALLLAVLCTGFANTASGETAEAVERKFHPGHYIALTLSDDGVSAIRRALHPGVAGVQKRYTWRELEPREDLYDFSVIAADLAVMEESGAQLVVFINDKSFRDERITPEYLWDAYTLPIRSAEPGQGYVAKRWDPFVVERLSKLLVALGKQFDANPRFEGVALQESALGIDTAILDREGYTAPAYRDALMQMLANARRAMPQSQVFWYLNYLPQNQRLLPSVAAAAARDGIALGGPDVLPDSEPLVRLVYPVLEEQRGTALLFTSAQNDSFRHAHSGPQGDTKYWTPVEIFEFARDRLGVQYLFWNDVQSPNPPDSYSIEDAYPVIAANPHFNATPQPASGP
jgi:hypothetical protein